MALFSILGPVLLGLLASGPLLAGSPDRSILIHIATDPHYLASSLWDSGPAFTRMAASPDGRLVGLMDPILDATQAQLVQDSAEILVITGDLTNNGERQSHLDLASRLSRIEQSGIAVFVIPGNHDLDNPLARGYRGTGTYKVPTVSAGDFASIYADFGYREALARDTGSLSYIVQAKAGLWFLMLDTTRHAQNLSTGRSQASGAVMPQTLEWIGLWLDKAASAGIRVLPFMHHSLLDHSSMIRRGFTLDNGEEVAKLFAAKSLRVSFSGHIHIQSIARPAPGTPAVYDVATASLAVHPHQLGAVAVDLDAGTLSYSTRKVDVEAWAKASGSKDPRLLSFAPWSAKAFGEASDRLMEQFEKERAGMSRGSLSAMAATLRQLNLAFFAGRVAEEEAAIRAGPGFQEFTAAPESMLKAYVLGVVAEAGASGPSGGENNALEMRLR